MRIQTWRIMTVYNFLMTKKACGNNRIREKESGKGWMCFEYGWGLKELKGGESL
jgi:hypothetical protein